MEVREGQLRRVAGAATGAGNRRQSWPERQGLLLELEGAGGRRGVGEASPLPGFSRDGLALAEAELLGWLARLPRPLSEVAEVFAAAGELASPAARFAAETALLDLLGQERGVPLHRLLAGARPFPASLPLVHLLPLEGAPAAAARLLAEGVRHFKIKVGGPDFAAELALLAELRGLGRQLELRLDANGGWAGEDREARIAALTPYQPELLEEPGGSFELAAPFPLALDESLADPAVRAALPDLLRRGDFRVLILKPMALGGFAVCLELARIAAAAGGAVVVSHLFDGPVGLAAAAHLAFALPGRVLPCGLARHAGLAAWRDSPVAAPPAFVGRRELQAPSGPGLLGEPG